MFFIDYFLTQELNKKIDEQTKTNIKQNEEIAKHSEEIVEQNKEIVEQNKTLVAHISKIKTQNRTIYDLRSKVLCK